MLSLPISRTNLVPYIGAGVGGADVVFDTDSFSDGVTTVTGSENDVVIAGKILAGLRFRLSQNMLLDVGYKYFATRSVLQLSVRAEFSRWFSGRQNTLVSIHVCVEILAGEDRGAMTASCDKSHPIHIWFSRKRVLYQWRLL